MALNIKNAEVERLATEVAMITGESKTEAIRVALEERRGLLRAEGKGTRADELRRWLTEEVWPSIPPESREQPIPKEFYDALYE